MVYVILLSDEKLFLLVTPTIGTLKTFCDIFDIKYLVNGLIMGHMMKKSKFNVWRPFLEVCRPSKAAGGNIRPAGNIRPSKRNIL
jgi:hypothetical protein